MLEKQEPKYDVTGDGHLFNRRTGDIIPDDEPIMVFRAKDAKSIDAIAEYLKACTDPVHRIAITRRLDDFVQYQANNPALVHEPDTELWPLNDEEEV